MCLIAYSPKGKPLTREIFDSARWTNPHGIGVMSSMGVEKFLGRKAGKRAWRYLIALPPETPFAVHFRWATHGAVCSRLTHPFTIPGRRSYVMHNGVIHKTAKLALRGEVSDTSLYVAWYMKNFPAPSSVTHDIAKRRLEKDIQWDKMVIYHADEDEWTLANEDCGAWIDGIWYSNRYSLPDEYQPARSYYGAAYGAAYKDADYIDTRDWSWKGELARVDNASPGDEWRKHLKRFNRGDLLPSGPTSDPASITTVAPTNAIAENGESYMTTEKVKV